MARKSQQERIKKEGETERETRTNRKKERNQKEREKRRIDRSTLFINRTTSWNVGIKMITVNLQL